MVTYMSPCQEHRERGNGLSVTKDAPESASTQLRLVHGRTSEPDESRAHAVWGMCQRTGAAFGGRESGGRRRLSGGRSGAGGRREGALEMAAA